MKQRSHHAPCEATPTITVCMHVLGSARTDGRVLREASALVAAGFAVSIVDIERETTPRLEEEFQGIHLKHVTVPDVFLTTRFTRHAFLRAARLCLRSTRLLVQTQADIYHAHDVSGLFPCVLAALVRRKPLIFDAHELPLDAMSIRTPWLLTLLALLLRCIVPRCAGVITVSSPIAREIRRRYHSREIVLVRNIPTYQRVAGEDCLHQRLRLPPETRIALFQGYIQASRGLDLLIQAAKFLEPNTVIVIMGQGFGSTIAQLEALIADEGVADRVRMIPPVPSAELLAWTSSADLGLIVYRPDYSMNVRMCLPNKLFEYLMAGLPVLASQLDAVSELIRTYEVGRIIPTLTPEGVAETLNALLQDEPARAHMRRNALQAAADDLCWEIESQQLIQLYQRICPTRGATALQPDASDGVAV